MSLFEHFLKILSRYLEDRTRICIRIRIKVKGRIRIHIPIKVIRIRNTDCDIILFYSDQERTN
jgi:hypothetical protein